MKYQTTKKQIMNGYTNVIKVPYCALQTLLKHNEPVAYTTSKAYGWQADVYEINQNTVIVTGYGPFGNIVPDHDLLMKYELKAEKEIDLIWKRWRDYGLAYKDREYYSQAYKEECECLWRLLREFIAEVTPN